MGNVEAVDASASNISCRVINQPHRMVQRKGAALNLSPLGEWKVTLSAQFVTCLPTLPSSNNVLFFSATLCRAGRCAAGTRNVLPVGSRTRRGAIGRRSAHRGVSLLVHHGERGGLCLDADGGYIRGPRRSTGLLSGPYPADQGRH